MPDRNAIARGFEFEKRVNDALHLRSTPGSGNKWYNRGDGSGGGIMVESKAEKIKTWREVKSRLALAAEEAQGTGDVPVLALLDEDDEECVIMTLADFSRIRTELMPVQVQETKAEARKRRAATPLLLREEL
jgi:hypothetical protein